MTTLRDRLKNEIAIVRGTAPAMQPSFGEPAYTDQNDGEVFNLANVPDDGHMGSETMDADGFDPFLGIQTVQGEDESLPYYRQDRPADVLDKSQRMTINTREEPSEFWRPYTVTIADTNNYEIAGIDNRRRRITLVNPSTSTVYLSRNQNSSTAGIADLSIPLLPGASLTITTVDQIWANTGSVTPGVAIRLAVIVEY